MTSLTQQRCFHHEFREAVACCPACDRYFCRECVTEHEDRVLCAACLGRLLKEAPLIQSGRYQGLLLFVQCLMGMGIAWMFFFLLGWILLALPTSFHEGTLWTSGWWGD